MTRLTVVVDRYNLDGTVAMTRNLFAYLLFFSSLLNASDVQDLEASLQKFIHVFNVIDANLAEPFDPTTSIYRGALPGMVRTLDPYSAFLDSHQFEALQEMQRSTEKGFGSVVNLLPGRAIVLQTLPGSPSERAGLLAGDEILAVNGYQLSQLPIEQLVALLTQARQSRAALVVKRPSIQRLMPIDLIPAELADPSVTRVLLLEDGIGHIKVANFEQQTADELRDAIEELGGHDLDGLILDLRGNPGGVVETAVQTVTFFLKPDQQILWIQGRDGPHEDLRVPEGLEFYEFSLAVLIDSKTASAAELVTSALQDNGRAIILGERSFGKGIIQSVYPLSEGAALALTTAQYLTPSRKVIQRPLGDCRVFLLAKCSEVSTGEGSTSQQNGGIQPDEVILPRGYTTLEAVLESTNSFFEFSQKYRAYGITPDADLVISDHLLDEFQAFLSNRKIQPSLAEWTTALTFIRSRLKQEIFNLAFGVDKGDEVETLRDPQVLMAVRQVKQKIEE